MHSGIRNFGKRNNISEKQLLEFHNWMEDNPDKTGSLDELFQEFIESLSRGIISRFIGWLRSKFVWIIGPALLISAGACEDDTTSPEVITVTDTVEIFQVDTVTVYNVIFAVDTVYIKGDTVIVQWTDTVRVDVPVINSGVLEGAFRDVYQDYCDNDLGVHQFSLVGHWMRVTNLLVDRIGEGPVPLSCR